MVVKMFRSGGSMTRPLPASFASNVPADPVRRRAARRFACSFWIVRSLPARHRWRRRLSDRDVDGAAPLLSTLLHSGMYLCTLLMEKWRSRRTSFEDNELFHQHENSIEAACQSCRKCADEVESWSTLDEAKRRMHSFSDMFLKRGRKEFEALSCPIFLLVPSEHADDEVGKLHGCTAAAAAGGVLVPELVGSPHAAVADHGRWRGCCCRRQTMAHFRLSSATEPPYQL